MSEDLRPCLGPAEVLLGEYEQRERADAPCVREPHRVLQLVSSHVLENVCLASGFLSEIPVLSVCIHIASRPKIVSFVLPILKWYPLTGHEIVSVVRIMK
jgi:hypothetical protein